MAESSSMQLENQGVVPTGTEDPLIRHQRGDQAAFSELVRTFAAPVYSYLTRCGVAEAERDDLFQEAFTKIHQSRHRYDGERPLKPWVYTIVANAVRSYFRSRPAAVEVPEGVDEPQGEATPEALMTAKETAAFLEEQLSRLSLPQREVVLLVCTEQLELRDVSEILEISVNTVKTHLRRARMELARALIRRKRRSDREVSR